MLHELQGSSQAVLRSSRAGAPSLVLTVSITRTPALVTRVTTLTGLDASVSRGGRTLASTLEGRGFRFPPPGDVRDFEIEGEEYRGRFVRLGAPGGPAVELGIFSSTASLSAEIADNRRLKSPTTAG